MSFIDKELSDYILNYAGILLIPNEKPLLEIRLNDFFQEWKFTSSSNLIGKLQQDKELREQFFDLITINETLWFRDSHPFDFICKVVDEDFQKSQMINVWSAACSTGQEAYSLAILLSEQQLANRVSIRASDISQEVIEKAQQAKYDQFSISRGISPELVNKYFNSHTDYWQLRNEIRTMVNFNLHNLADPIHHLPKLDIVLLRNVLIYFGPQFRKALLDRIVDHLNPNGIIIVGGAENINTLNPQLKMKSHKKTIYYQKEE